jgi:hypothetical protein
MQDLPLFSSDTVYHNSIILRTKLITAREQLNVCSFVTRLFAYPIKHAVLVVAKENIFPNIIYRVMPAETSPVYCNSSGRLHAFH